MRFSIWTTCTEVGELAKQCGGTVLNFDGWKTYNPIKMAHDFAFGFGKTLNKASFVFTLRLGMLDTFSVSANTSFPFSILHLDGYSSKDKSDDTPRLLSWLDKFILAFDQIPNTKWKTMLALVMGPIQMTSTLNSEPNGYAIRIPQQSFQSQSIDSSSCFLSTRRLRIGIRRDALDRLSQFRDFYKGSYAMMSLDRLIPEIAYKLGYASKYGS